MCPFVCRNEHQMKVHNANGHARKKWYCDVCNKYFAQTTKVVTHRSTNPVHLEHLELFQAKEERLRAEDIDFGIDGGSEDESQSPETPPAWFGKSPRAEPRPPLSFRRFKSVFQGPKMGQSSFEDGTEYHIELVAEFGADALDGKSEETKSEFGLNGQHDLWTSLVRGLDHFGHYHASGNTNTAYDDAERYRDDTRFNNDKYPRGSSKMSKFLDYNLGRPPIYRITWKENEKEWKVDFIWPLDALQWHFELWWEELILAYHPDMLGEDIKHDSNTWDWWHIWNESGRPEPGLFYLVVFLYFFDEYEPTLRKSGKTWNLSVGLANFATEKQKEKFRRVPVALLKKDTPIQRIIEVVVVGSTKPLEEKSCLGRELSSLAHSTYEATLPDKATLWACLSTSLTTPAMPTGILLIKRS